MVWAASRRPGTAMAVSASLLFDQKAYLVKVMRTRDWGVLPDISVYDRILKKELMCHVSIVR